MIHVIKHQTVFDFEETPRSVVQRLHLTPPNLPFQTVEEWGIEVEGGMIGLETDDYHGNRIHLCHHDMESRRIQITCSGRVEVEDTTGIVGRHDNRIPLMLFKNHTRRTSVGPLLRQMIDDMESIRAGSDDDIGFLHELSARVINRVPYIKGKTDTGTSAEQAMELKAGVCQDHVHIFSAIARELGYPTRYVSGYLMIDGQKDQEATHAWADVHVDTLGWVGFDISNSISPDARYVRLGTGFDYQDTVPVSGVRVGSAEEQLSTSITVSQQ